MTRRRVVVTGMGVVSPVGNDVPAFWQSLLAGRSGVSFIRDFPIDKLRSDVSASVVDFDPGRYLGPKEADIHGRVTQFSIAAADEAVKMAGLDKPDGVALDRVGCLVSTGMGAVDIFQSQLERSRDRGPRAVSPYFIPGVMPNAAAAVISIQYGFKVPSYNIASACATGTHSLATSAMMIECGDADIMLAGGAESATRLDTVAGFGNARALARSIDGDPTKASRPFDKRRHGFVMGEGAGVVVGVAVGDDDLLDEVGRDALLPEGLGGLRELLQRLPQVLLGRGIRAQGLVQGGQGGLGLGQRRLGLGDRRSPTAVGRHSPRPHP